MERNQKTFSDYLGDGNGSIIFLQPTNNKEKANIIFFFNYNKASSPNSMTYRVLFLLEK